MNKLNVVNILISVIFTILGSYLLIMPFFNKTNITFIFLIMMLIYAILAFFRYLILKNNKFLLLAIDTIIISIILIILTLIKEPLSIQFSLLCWLMVVSFIKLFQADYYNERKDLRWILSITNFGLFIIIGLLTIINLNYFLPIKFISLGFFFFITGALDVMEHSFNYIMDKK